MKRRNQGWIVAGLLLALAACTVPSGSGTPGTSPSAAAATSPAAAAAGTPTTISVEGFDDDDKQGLSVFFDSDEVQQYWGNDIVSDGSGAYFTAQSLADTVGQPTQQTVSQPLGAQALRPRLAARRALPVLRQFRKRDLTNISRAIHIRTDGNKDQAIIEATVKQKGTIDLDTATESRSVDVSLRQRQTFHARRANGRWQLAKVGRVVIEPDNDSASLSVLRLTAKADGQTILDLSSSSDVLAVDQLPIVKPGQSLDITVATARSDQSPTTGILAIMRLPRLSRPARLQPDITEGTFSRTFTVPDQPGLHRAGAELLDLQGLTDDPEHLDLTVWGFTFRIRR